MVFLIQNTQNRTTAALQLKVDEVIRSLRGANNALVKTDELSLEEIERLRAQCERLAMNARTKVNRGQTDVGTPKLDIK
jgi:low affinity Fe/Cu permease